MAIVLIPAMWSAYYSEHAGNKSPAIILINPKQQQAVSNTIPVNTQGNQHNAWCRIEVNNLVF